MTTHPPPYLHLCNNMHLLDMRVLDWPTLIYIQQFTYTHTYINGKIIIKISKSSFIKQGYVTTKTNCLLVVKFIKKEDIQSLELIPQMVTQLCTLLSESHSTFNFHSKVTQLLLSFSESHSTGILTRKSFNYPLFPQKVTQSIKLFFY